MFFADQSSISRQFQYTTISNGLISCKKDVSFSNNACTSEVILFPKIGRHLRHTWPFVPRDTSRQPRKDRSTEQSDDLTQSVTIWHNLSGPQSTLTQSWPHLPPPQHLSLDLPVYNPCKAALPQPLSLQDGANYPLAGHLHCLGGAKGQYDRGLHGGVRG